MQENVPGIDFINALRPVTYHYDVAKQEQMMGAPKNSDRSKQEGKYEIEKIPFTGLIAQEVDPAAQRLGYDFSGVDKTGKIMGIRYSEFVPPIIKAVQELSGKMDKLNAPTTKENADVVALKETVKNQQTVINNQQKQIEDLSSKLDAVLNQMNVFEQSLSQCCTAFGNNSQKVDVAILEQNVPNPFGHSSYIKFYVPKNARSASLRVTDGKGAIVLQFNKLETGFGTVTIHEGELSSGTYYYSLIIDDHIVDTKSMVITK